MIIFRPEEVIKKYNLRLSMNAVLVTDCVLPLTTIELAYVVPPTNSGRSWVLYNPDLIGRKIMGHTPPSHGKYADARPSDQDIPQGSGHIGCGWRKCPCCKSVNPKGFTACLNCRVMFTFDPITEVSKVVRRTVDKGEDAGSTPASSNPKVVTKVPVEIAAQEALRIAKLQVRADRKLEQRYLRPGDHLWEVVKANMKWRIRFDEMTYDEQQAFIASGKSRFCAGEKFDKHHLDPGKGGKGVHAGSSPARPIVQLRYGGAIEYLQAQENVMSDVGRAVDMKSWILRQKIYIVGVLADEIEREYPWSTENRDSLKWFKQNTGKTLEFLDMWLEILADLLRQQRITLQQLMSAEHSRHENRVKVAEIMRKPDAEMTAEDMEVIAARIVARGKPSGSSSRPDIGKGPRVEDDAHKGLPRAAPAVVRKISKAPPGQPPRRTTPPVDPPAKCAKGASKGAADWAASGSRSGKGKGKWGGKGKFKNGPPEWYRPPGQQGFGHLPAPPPFNGPAQNGPPDGARRLPPPDGARRLPIQKNQYRDVREVDRQRRERAYEPPNNAYREWHDAVWVGQHLAPPADDHDYGRNDRRAGTRSRSSGWHPSLHPPSHMDGRRRTRSPARRFPNNRDLRPYYSDDTDWEKFDWDESEWDRQNQRFQDRRNEEYQRETRGW